MFRFWLVDTERSLSGTSVVGCPEGLAQVVLDIVPAAQLRAFWWYPTWLQP